MICPRCHSHDTVPAMVRGKQSIGHHGPIHWCNGCGKAFGENFKPPKEEKIEPIKKRRKK